MDYIIYFALSIGILVFIHEFGHFIAAKLSGMRVEVFAIGFGKRLVGWNKKTRLTFGELPKDFEGEGNTDYRLSMLPLGGYVKIAGMIDESFDTKFTDKEPQPYEFRAKPMWQKVFVITAGVIMNLMLAWAILWGGNFFRGKPVTNTTTIAHVENGSLADSLGFKSHDKIISLNGEKVNYWEEVTAQLFIHSLGEDVNVVVQRNGTEKTIFIPRSRIPEESQLNFLIPEGFKTGIGEVQKDSPAMAAGLKSGDIFLKINHAPIFSSQQVVKTISGNPQKEISVEVLRGEDTLKYSVTPGKDGMIGIRLAYGFVGGYSHSRTYGFFESIYRGGVDIVMITDLTFSMVGKVFSGKIEFGKAFGGPVKIAQFAAKSAEGGFSNFLYFLAMLSLSLAILNIMPFPVLDGGHLVIILIEGITKREIPVKVKIAIQNTGLIILLLLMAFVIYNDILTF